MSNEVNSAVDDRLPGGESAMQREYMTIDLRRFFWNMWRKKMIVIGFTLAGVGLAVLASLLQHPQYDSMARMQPPTSRETSFLSLMPSRNEGDIYLGLLSSRSVADDVIEHQHLRDYFHTTHASDLRRRLARMSAIKVDKDQFITVTVRAPEPETATRIANEYVDALYRLSHSIALAEAAHRWEYFEGPLEQEKNKLAQAEEELKSVQQATGMVLPEAQVRAGVTALAQLKQEIAGREVQLAALRTSSTDMNPQVVLLKSQIANLQGQVARMEAETGGDTGPKGAKAKLPQLTLEVERKMREVKYHETLFEVLARQYENARIDRSYTSPVEVVDRAIVPDEKAWPPRKLFVIVGFLAGAFLGVLYVLLTTSKVIGSLWREFRSGDPDSPASSLGR